VKEKAYSGRRIQDRVRLRGVLTITGGFLDSLERKRGVGEKILGCKREKRGRN